MSQATNRPGKLKCGLPTGNTEGWDLAFAGMVRFSPEAAGDRRRHIKRELARAAEQ